MATHEVKPYTTMFIYAVDKHRSMCVELFTMFLCLLYGILQTLFCGTVVISFVSLRRNYYYTVLAQCGYISNHNLPMLLREQNIIGTVFSDTKLFF